MLGEGYFENKQNGDTNIKEESGAISTVEGESVVRVGLSTRLLIEVLKIERILQHASHRR